MEKEKIEAIQNNKEFVEKILHAKDVSEVKQIAKEDLNIELTDEDIEYLSQQTQIALEYAKNKGELNEQELDNISGWLFFSPLKSPRKIATGIVSGAVHGIARTIVDVAKAPIHGAQSAARHAFKHWKEII